MFKRFFQVACCLAALLAALAIVPSLDSPGSPATWPIYLAGSIVLGLDAIAPILLKGRLVWAAIALATLTGTGLGLLARQIEQCCPLALGYPYSWILDRDGWSLNIYLLGLDLLFWLCAAAAAAGLILGIRHLLTTRLPRPDTAPTRTRC
ncbi:hypothetical protein Rhe02_35310 [Rhizocola hellebori]|uniref:Uncharacterized protein n=1 Tax=Rhizocola hellebori TaxID=1392758 RepID=A0A8J3Q8M2_9ACTN|nr:hypothetical protein [Rhizocola hellebori]GIH05464.1 hypothetical protein Rhe02_35310 [Rhizocola hellebori]